MYILSIEQSTPVCSIALMQDYRIVAGKEWEDTRMRNQHFFTLLPELLQKASITPADIDILALGLGPGSFSGVRCALSALNGLALPDKKRVFGVESSEALAWQIMQERSCNSVMVLGDARRGHIWHVCYDRTENNIPRKRYDISLVMANQLSSILQTNTTIATSDWDRIGSLIKQSLIQGINIIEERRTPKAQTVGELAFRKISSNLPSEPLLPIYLHPPVAAQVTPLVS